MASINATQSGSTLLEVVLAGFLLSLSVVSLATLYGQSAYVLSQAQRYQAAVLLSADFWELAQRQPPLALAQPAARCRKGVLEDAWGAWSQRWQCQLPQARVDLLRTASGLSLQWFDLHPHSDTSADWVVGPLP